jgi:probable HAF family extracellular repeat protein
MYDLGTLGGATSAAYAINESGQVTGFSDNGTALHAFLHSDGVMSALDTLDYYQSGAFDINDDGQMSGVVVPFSGAPSAVVFDGNDIFDLGAAISGGSQAWNINNSGMVTGYAWGSGAYRSFLYAAGQLVEIGALAGFRDTYVYGLNDAGQAAGIMTNPDTGLSHAFLYSGGVMIDLNDVLLPEHGWEYVTAAFAINNAGQIAGYGRTNGQFCGFLLTPAP